MGTSRCPAAPTVRKGPTFPAQVQHFAVLVQPFRAQRGVENQHPPHSGPGPTPAPRHLVPQMPLGWDPGPSRRNRPPHSSNSGRPTAPSATPDLKPVQPSAQRPGRLHSRGGSSASATVPLLPGPKPHLRSPSPLVAALELQQPRHPRPQDKGQRAWPAQPVSMSLRSSSESRGLNTRPSLGIPSLFSN